ncbi:pickpocket protein 19-like [Eurosta solidaginis]|uniref:pickpocket protein 19-like n=1 Tax=Eurosta solidaginis TaxID=178769 RepID=UPI0035308EF9
MVQIYFNELPCPTKQRKGRNQLLLPNARTLKPTFKKSNLCHDLLLYSRNYCEISSLHGIKNITDTQRRYYERVIWLLLLIATTCSCLYVYQQFTDLYFAQRLVTVVDDSMSPIFIVPFPSIGICPRNRINWPKLLLAHQLFMPPNASVEVIETFRQFFASLSNFRFGKFQDLQPLMKPELNLSVLDKLDIKAVMAHVSFSCDEIFQQPCFWRQKSYNCCELFEMELTEYGFCMMFNSLISEKNQQKQRNNRFYPYHNSDIGEGTGLDIFINLNESKQPPGLTETNGVYVILKRPEKYTGSTTFINYNTYTKLPVTPQLSTVDEKTRVISPEERKCFLDELENDHPLYKTLPGMEYGSANCYARCRQEYVYQKCKCNLNLCYPQYMSDNMIACKAKDYRCLYENWEFFSVEHHVSEQQSQYLVIENISSHIECNCLAQCKKLIYDTIPINMPIAGLSSVVKQIHLDVHYTSIYMITYRTNLHYTFVELLGSLGGIFGLFLGASLMSAVELFYYFTIGLYTHLNDRGYTLNGLFNLWKRKAKSSTSKKRTSFSQSQMFVQNTNQYPVFYLRH